MSLFERQRANRRSARSSESLPDSTLSPASASRQPSLKIPAAASEPGQSLYPASVLLASDFESFKQQQTVFIVLNLFVLAALLLIHTLFSWHWGNPSVRLVAVLAVAFLAQVGELFWLIARLGPLSPRAVISLTWLTIGSNILLSMLLAYITKREDTQYFILMVVPVLVAAFRLALLPTLGLVAFVDVINFLVVWTYGRHRTPAPVGEYFEAGTVSLIYTVVGVLVWLLVNQLHQNQSRLSRTLVDLEHTRERLLEDERLAAVGRLSSAIAHEIRNPVAAIASALSTAKSGSLEAAEREEMFDIAAKEAIRLETLTTDFLAYARPRDPRKVSGPIDDTLAYVADICRTRSNEKDVVISVEESGDLMAEIDAAQVQQALVNLVMNGVEAAPWGGRVKLRAVKDHNGSIRIDVEEDGPAIPPETVGLIFEPFFTTKPEGTGLGLAIARNIIRAHGGDLILAVNEQGRVCFSIILP
jgi:signal transduction histidine kinase